MPQTQIQTQACKETIKKVHICTQKYTKANLCHPLVKGFKAENQFSIDEMRWRDHKNRNIMQQSNPIDKLSSGRGEGGG